MHKWLVPLQCELTSVFCLKTKCYHITLFTCQYDNLIGPLQPTFPFPLLTVGTAIHLVNEEAKYSDLQAPVFWQAGVSTIYGPVSSSALVSADDTLVISILYPYHIV